MFILDVQAFDLWTSQSDAPCHSATRNFIGFCKQRSLHGFIPFVPPKKTPRLYSNWNSWRWKYVIWRLLTTWCFTLHSCKGLAGMENSLWRCVWCSSFGEGSRGVAYICTTTSGPKKQPSLKVFGSYYQGNGGGWSLWDVMVGLSCWLTCPIFEDFRNLEGWLCCMAIYAFGLGKCCDNHGLGRWLFGRSWSWWFKGIMFLKYWLLALRLALSIYIYTIGYSRALNQVILRYIIKSLGPLEFWQSFQWKKNGARNSRLGRHCHLLALDVRHRAERTWCNRSMHIFVVTWRPVSGNKDLEMMPFHRIFMEFSIFQVFKQ